MVRQQIGERSRVQAFPLVLPILDVAQFSFLGFTGQNCATRNSYNHKYDQFVPLIFVEMIWSQRMAPYC